METEKKIKTEAAQFPTAEPTTLVVGVYPGTLDVVKKFFVNPSAKVVFIEAPESGDSILEIIAQAAALPEVPEEYTLVPCGCIPCGGADMDSMRLSTVYVSRSGKRVYNNGLPLVINSAQALEVLKEIETSHKDEPDGDVAEAFAEKYITVYRPRPVEVSFTFGNYVTPVKRANPCENVVIQAFIQKKFITATKEGFEAITPLLLKY